MHDLHSDLLSFQQQLQAGSLQNAYRALLGYMLKLRTHFKDAYPQFAVSGLYQGYLDMTYFAIFPPELKRRDLKIAIVFNYSEFRFEAWLAAANRQVQRKVWELFRQGDWGAYRVTAPGPGIDAIVECDLAAGLEVCAGEALTAKIETGVQAFVARIEQSLD